MIPTISMGMREITTDKISALLTDSYQLSMMQAYLEAGMTETAVFELFVRRLPQRRNFLLAAGLEQLLDALETLRFESEEIDWLRATGRYRPRLLDYLRNFRFSGEVEAMEEGTPFFADEPIVRVVAPLPEAQLVESRLINILHFQTLIASKAARSALAAPERLLVDFGMRRAHGAEAALYAARASFLAGYSGTSTVAAGRSYGIPVYGTMAHSFIQAHLSETQAFEGFAAAQSGPITFLIDTYDTESAAMKVARLAPRLLARGIPLYGVRLDSGDLGEHSRRVRAILDQAGLRAMHIFVSGNLDEEEIDRLLRSGAPIDGFGVGTRLTTSADAPYLDCAYKLQEYAGKPRRKKSEGKATWPGRKQVYRFRAAEGTPIRDQLVLLQGAEKPSGGEPLLRPVMRHGERLGPSPPLEQIRRKALRRIADLPPELKRLEPASVPYPVEISQELRDLAASLDQERHA